MTFVKHIIGEWNVETLSNNGDKGINPCLVNDSLKISIKISHDHLRVFGYCTAGCELGIIGGDNEGSKQEKILALIEIISIYTSRLRCDPGYMDIRRHLKNYKGKMRFSKYIPPSQSTLNAINKTLEIIEDDWQVIVLNTIKELEKYKS